MGGWCIMGGRWMMVDVSGVDGEGVDGGVVGQVVLGGLAGLGA